MSAARWKAIFGAALCLGGLAASCAVVQKGADALGEAGAISETDRKAIVQTSQALRSTFADITEEEEYYIGRAVSALVLSQYPVYQNDALTTYLNALGQAVAYFSDRPETYAGYHFLVLDTDEVNAMSAPGGFIFLSKGLIKRCRNEEMLAAVIAHEIGHVSARHGLQSIKKSRLVDAFRIIGKEAARRYGPQELAELTEVFEGALGDVVETLVVRGYDRKFEYEADELAVKFAASIGYAAQGLLDFLETMVGDSSSVSAKGWFKTHPSAEDRIERIKKKTASLTKPPVEEPARTKRFNNIVAGLK